MIVKSTKQSDSFGMKADLMGLSLDDKINGLNGMYKGALHFGKSHSVYSGEIGITVDYINVDVESIQLPECNDYVVDDLISCSWYNFSFLGHPRKLKSIQLPKSIKEINLDACHWLQHFERVFMWDTTKITGNFDNFRPGKLNMIAIKSTTGGKAKIIRFKGCVDSVY